MLTLYCIFRVEIKVLIIFNIQHIANCKEVSCNNISRSDIHMTKSNQLIAFKWEMVNDTADFSAYVHIYIHIESN